MSLGIFSIEIGPSPCPWRGDNGKRFILVRRTGMPSREPRCINHGHNLRREDVKKKEEPV